MISELAHLWRALHRNAAWIEPTFVSEWARLIREYAERRGCQIAEEKMVAAMRWSEPERDALQARRIAVSLLGFCDLHCVWTGRLLTASTLDVDHMFPWAAWPCSDLWNLLPADRNVNQRLKRSRLPSAATLSRAEDDHALVAASIPAPEQFLTEARASLPTFSSSEPSDVFAAVTLQRIRLRHDQQAPEWDGVSRACAVSLTPSSRVAFRLERTSYDGGSVASDPGCVKIQQCEKQIECFSQVGRNRTPSQTLA
jgi:hypothetical protein